MISLFYFVLVVLGLAAIAMTVHAFLSARSGHEDEKGFHAVPRRPGHETDESKSRRGIFRFRLFRTRRK